MLLTHRYYMQRQSARNVGGPCRCDARSTTRGFAPPMSRRSRASHSSTKRDKFGGAAQGKSASGAGRYPRTQPGQVARYYDALTLEQLERYAESEKAFKARWNLPATKASPSPGGFPTRANLRQNRQRVRRPCGNTSTLSISPTYSLPKPVGAAGPGRTLQPERSRASHKILPTGEVGDSLTRRLHSKPINGCNCSHPAKS